MDISTWILVLILFRACGQNPYGLLLALAAANFPPEYWNTIVDRYDSFTLIAAGTQVIFFVVYWGHGGLLLLLDLTQRPHFLYKYKIQRTRPMQRDKVWPVFRKITINQALVVVPMAVAIAYSERIHVSRTLPSHTEMIRDILVSVALAEVTFYYSHQALHTERLYRTIHKVHHEFQSPCAITAAYAHPVEMTLSNGLPIALGGVVMGSHAFTYLVWVLFALVSTQVGHSGYRFPWSPKGQPSNHDYHHEAFKWNYGLGSLCLLDRVCGTFVEPPAERRSL